MFILAPAYSQDYGLVGKIRYIDYQNNRHSVNKIVDYISYNDLIRLNISSKLYYIVNVSSRKVFIVNKKRKKVTITTISALTSFDLPPIEILKNSIELKNYIKENQASFVKKLTNSNEVWKYNKGKQLCFLEIKMPEFTPLLLDVFEFGHKNASIKILEKKQKAKNQLPNDTFIVPNEFKLIDLTSQ